MESFRNIGCLRKIDPFDQGEVHFNIKSEVNCVSEEYVIKKEHLLLSMMMMIMMKNSFLGPLAVVMIRKKKMMKRLKTINFSVVFL